MFCRRIKRRLYALSEGELNPAQAAQIKAHLQTCAKCAREYRQLRQLLQLAAQKPTPQPSAQFWANFDRELEEKLAGEKLTPKAVKLRLPELPRFNLKPAYVLAGVCIFLLAVSFYFFGGLPTKARLSELTATSLVEDIRTLEELTDDLITLNGPESIINEYALLEDLS